MVALGGPGESGVGVLSGDLVGSLVSRELTGVINAPLAMEREAGHTSDQNLGFSPVICLLVVWMSRPLILYKPQFPSP